MFATPMIAIFAENYTSVTPVSISQCMWGSPDYCSKSLELHSAREDNDCHVDFDSFHAVRNDSVAQKSHLSGIIKNEWLMHIGLFSLVGRPPMY